jgi:hypothetical protein
MGVSFGMVRFDLVHAVNDYHIEDEMADDAELARARVQIQSYRIHDGWPPG